MLNILITNDDGYDFIGIQSLKEALKNIANVTISAPSREMSACSQAITLTKPITVTDHGDRIFSVDGYTADSVNIALFSKINQHNFDLVISGINKGVNMGCDTFYSGTVAGARHAYIHGFSAIAISCGYLDETGDFLSVGNYLANFLEKIYPKLEKPFLLNINYPIDKNNGQIKWTNLGKRQYSDRYASNLLRENVEEFYFKSSVLGFFDIKNSDFEAYEQGYISITPLHLDSTHYENLKKWRNIEYVERTNK